MNATAFASKDAKLAWGVCSEIRAEPRNPVQPPSVALQLPLADGCRLKKVNNIVEVPQDGYACTH